MLHDGYQDIIAQSAVSCGVQHCISNAQKGVSRILKSIFFKGFTSLNIQEVVMVDSVESFSPFHFLTDYIFNYLE